MRILRERFSYYLMGTILCASATFYFFCTVAWSAAILFAVGTAVLAIRSVRDSTIKQASRLITENPLLSVGVASVTEAGTKEKAEPSVKVIVSGFGVLLDGRPYAFGPAFGPEGAKLKTTSIDRESITLSFGDEEKAYSVRLLHGIADKTDVEKLVERLRYETGVAANVSGW